ncbi:hypothetical protein SUGI_0445420 [Cryptomeria japonica]|nr:hypothetical protein SUGI_0445420 [Cryptomeria japonica]
MEAVTEFTNILIFEGMPVISDNGNRNTISANDIVEDECSNLFSYDLCETHGFNPFCKILYGSDNEFMTIGRRRVNLAYEIESPLTKGPRRRKWLKFLCWHMYKVSMNLTLLTFLDKLI